MNKKKRVHIILAIDKDDVGKFYEYVMQSGKVLEYTYFEACPKQVQVDYLQALLKRIRKK